MSVGGCAMSRWVERAGGNAQAADRGGKRRGLGGETTDKGREAGSPAESRSGRSRKEGGEDGKTKTAERRDANVEMVVV